MLGHILGECTSCLDLLETHSQPQAPSQINFKVPTLTWNRFSPRPPAMHLKAQQQFTGTEGANLSQQCVALCCGSSVCGGALLMCSECILPMESDPLCR